MPTCRVCGAENFSIFVPASMIDEECRTRERFIKERLSRPASQDELKDLTNFYHQAKADILSCAGCKLLLRSEHEPSEMGNYMEDEYDSSVIERVYPRYLDAFRAKETPYRALLPQGAWVLEIGSHYGAFLETAHEWGWRAEGVDIGRDTSRFARAKGFAVHTKELQDCGFANSTFDGVFIWNCFEQIEDPKPLLRECRRILKSSGVLTLRTPNGLFYALCETLFRNGDLRPDATEFLIEAMGYNNLLGFPYLYGYSAENLERLVEQFGFRREGMLNSELLILPLPDNPAWVEGEERRISDEVGLLTHSILAGSDRVLAGPWIEVWFR